MYFVDVAQLILGTAQFGLDYGATNKYGRPDNLAAKQLLEISKRNKITTLDTAEAYGDSETRLGNMGATNDFKIITKFKLKATGPKSLSQHFHRLRVSKLQGLIFHDANEVHSSKAPVWIDALREMRENKTVELIGISAYTLQEIESAFAVFPDIELIQIPSNIVDMSTLESPLISEMVRNGVKVHVRSIFLQGVLLESESKLNGQFKAFKSVVGQVSNYASENSVSKLEVLLKPIQNHPNVDGVVIGTSSSEELMQIISAWRSDSKIEYYPEHTLHPNLLDPRKWRK